MRRPRYDLHLHTSRSDGEHPTAEVLRRCARGGLDVIALTDHDIPPEVEAGVHVVEGRELRVIAAVEASGVHAGRELHFLCYFPGAMPDGFRAFCAARCADRAMRYDAGRDAIGGELPEADAEARRGERALTRHHLARALVASGRARDLREAFGRWAGDAAGLVPNIPIDAGTVIDTARAHGALVSWAHPGRDQLQAWLPELVALGLQGVEGLRPRLTSADRRVYRAAAARHGLFVTGGSDWHGWYDLDPGLFAVEAAEIEAFVERLAS